MITQDEALNLLGPMEDIQYGFGKIFLSPEELTALCNAVRRKTLLEAAEHLESYDYLRTQPAIPYAEAHELRRMAEGEKGAGDDK